jgi:hypothetical protein
MFGTRGIQNQRGKASSGNSLQVLGYHNRRWCRDLRVDSVVEVHDGVEVQVVLDSQVGVEHL